jgi:hypothetical protein
MSHTSDLYYNYFDTIALFSKIHNLVETNLLTYLKISLFKFNKLTNFNKLILFQITLTKPNDTNSTINVSSAKVLEMPVVRVKLEPLPQDLIDTETRAAR